MSLPVIDGLKSALRRRWSAFVGVFADPCPAQAGAGAGG